MIRHMNLRLERATDAHYEDHEFQRVPIDVSIEHLPVEVREKATEDMVQLMREVLRGLEKYAVFASTGLYLYGKRIDDASLRQPPGDLDVAVEDEATLHEIMQRLRNVSGVTFDHEGIARPFHDETRVLAGKVLMSVNDTIISYPFEFFQNSRIVNENVFRHREKIEGLNVLTLEGLKKQYINNLALETRILRAVDEVSAFLNEHAEELQQEGPLRDVVCTTYNLSDEQLHDFYDIQRRLSTERNEKERERLQSINSRILSGVKTKVAKRLRNVQQLSEHLNT